MDSSLKICRLKVRMGGQEKDECANSVDVHVYQGGGDEDSPPPDRGNSMLEVGRAILPTFVEEQEDLQCVRLFELYGALHCIAKRQC